MKVVYLKCLDPKHTEVPKFYKITRLAKGKWQTFCCRWKPDGTLYEKELQDHDHPHYCKSYASAKFTLECAVKAISQTTLVYSSEIPEYTPPPKGSTAYLLQQRFFNKDFAGGDGVAKKQFDA